MSEHSSNRLERIRAKMAAEKEREHAFQHKFRKRSAGIFAFVFVIALFFSIDIFLLEPVTSEEVSESIETGPDGYIVKTARFTFTAVEEPVHTAGRGTFTIEHSRFLESIDKVSQGNTPVEVVKRFRELAIFLPICCVFSLLTAMGTYLPDKVWNICWFFSIVSFFVSALAYLALS